MKKISKLSFVLFSGAALSLLPITASAQPSVTTSKTEKTTTTTSEDSAAGTVTEFTPGSRIIVRGDSGSPTTYTMSKTVTYVDADGKVVKSSVIHAGTPTTVYYSIENGHPVVTKVVVTRSPGKKTETTTTTTTH